MPNDIDIFEDKVSDISLVKPKAGKGAKNKPERNLKKELFGKKDVNEVIDAYENSLGYPKKQKQDVNLKYKNKIFTANNAEDTELLNELMNSKDRYTIVMWKDTWTVHGDYKVFIIYAENTDSKELTEPSELGGNDNAE